MHPPSTARAHTLAACPARRASGLVLPPFQLHMWTRGPFPAESSVSVSSHSAPPLAATPPWSPTQARTQSGSKQEESEEESEEESMEDDDEREKTKREGRTIRGAATRARSYV